MLDCKLVVKGSTQELAKLRQRSEQLPSILTTYESFTNVDMYDVPENVTVKGLLHFLGDTNLFAEVLLNEEISLLVRRAA